MSLTTPQAVQERLEGIEDDLSVLQNEAEHAAFAWFQAKREREKARAISFLAAKGSIAARNAIADVETATDGMEAEARWEAKRSVLKVLETRANVGMAILKAQSHG